MQFNFVTFDKIRYNNETNIFTFGHFNRREQEIVASVEKTASDFKLL